MVLEVEGHQRSETSYQEAGFETRNSKSEIRKAKREARRGDCGAIPPLRNGKRRRCSGRDDGIKKGPTRHNAARKRKSGRPGRDDGGIPRFADCARNDGDWARRQRWKWWGAYQVKVFSIWAANSRAKLSRRCARSRICWRKWL